MNTWEKLYRTYLGSWFLPSFVKNRYLSENENCVNQDTDSYYDTRTVGTYLLERNLEVEFVWRHLGWWRRIEPTRCPSGWSRSPSFASTPPRSPRFWPSSAMNFSTIRYGTKKPRRVQWGFTINEGWHTGTYSNLPQQSPTVSTYVGTVPT